MSVHRSTGFFFFKEKSIFKESCVGFFFFLIFFLLRCIAVDSVLDEDGVIEAHRTFILTGKFCATLVTLEALKGDVLCPAHVIYQGESFT